MENKKIFLGMLVMALVFGMTVLGCESTHDHSAALYVTNISNSDYYISTTLDSSGRPLAPAVIMPGHTRGFFTFWNDGVFGRITIYYSSDLSAPASNWSTQTYQFFEPGENRNVTIP